MRLFYSIPLSLLAVFFLLNTALAFEQPLRDLGEIGKLEKFPDLPFPVKSPPVNPSLEEVPVIIQLKEPPLIEFRRGMEKEIERQLETEKPGMGIKASEAKLMETRVKGHEKAISRTRSEIKSKLERDFGAVFEKNRDYIHVFNGFAAKVNREHIDEIRRLPEVKNVFIDEMVWIQLSNSVPQINADDVWLETYEGSNVTGHNITVAVIDTGIDYTHPDLGNCTQSDFLSGSCGRTIYGWDFYNDDENPMDDHGHGTHCAGIIGANGTLKGVAPDVKFMAYKVLSSGGYGWTSDVIEAIENATLMNADVISMSLGGYGFADDAMKEPIDNAVLNGTIVVVGAGNSGPVKDSVGTPASVLSAITVGAVDSSDTIAYFSSRGYAYFSNGSIAGVKPDVVAPGVDINSTVPKGSGGLRDPSGYATASGTSMATPHVAGAVALLMQSHPEWSPEEIKSAISNTAVDVNEEPNTQGSGRIDVLKAYNVSSLIFPNNLFFIDLSNQTEQWNSTKFFNLTNLLGFQLSYNITYQISTSGINVTISNSTLNLSGGNSTLINFTLSLNSSEIDYGSHYGAILVNISNNQSLRLPFLLFKYTNSIYCPSGIIYINETTNLGKRIYCYTEFEENLSFVINSSNIIFDCNGSTFDRGYSSGSKGVYNNGFNNVTIRNCKFQNYKCGFYLNNTVNNTLTESSGDFGFYGIYLKNSMNVSIDNVTSNYNLGGTVLFNSTNSSITNLTSILNWYGIELDDSSHNLIDNVTFDGNLFALGIFSSFDNKINNIFSTNNMYDIYLDDNSSGNRISNSKMTNDFGISVILFGSPKNVFVNNSFNDSYYSIYIEGNSLNDFVQDMNSSNTVNGKPVYYLINQQNQTINNSNDPGFIGIVNSSNMTIRDLEIDRGGDGVLFAYTNNSKISNVSISNSYLGIALHNSFNNILDKLELTGNNSVGIYFVNSSDNLVNDTDISAILSLFDVYSVYSNNTFLNTTYSTEFCLTGCEITRKWYLTVNVTNSTHVGYQDANVSVRDSLGSFLWSENTSSGGLTSRYVTVQYVENEDNITDFTPHNITVKKLGHYTNTTNLTINRTMVARILLREDKEPPNIYNLSATNKTHDQTRITWKTDEVSRSIIYYGINSTNLSLNVSNSSFLAIHDFLLTDLSHYSTHYYNISSCDMYDNCVVNGTYNFTTEVCQEDWVYTEWSSCVGGVRTREATDLNNCGTSVNLGPLSESCGDSYQPTIANPLEFSTSWGSIPAGETKMISLGKDRIDITHFQFKLKNQRSSVSLRIEQLGGKPSPLPKPSGEVYSYIQINTSNITDENLEYAKLAFRVKKEWVNNNSIDTSLVYLNRYTNAWIKLNTELVNESSNYFNFESDSPGFSYFAITGEVYTPPQICTPNSRRCSGSNLQKCSADGYSWDTLETCQHGCDPSALTCKQEIALGCDPGSTRCYGNESQECNSEGQWTLVEECEYGCANGECNSLEFVFDFTTILVLVALVVVIIVVSVIFLGRKPAKEDEWKTLEERWKGKLKAKSKTTQPPGRVMTWEELKRKWSRGRKR